MITCVCNEQQVHYSLDIGEVHHSSIGFISVVYAVKAGKLLGSSVLPDAGVTPEGPRPSLSPSTIVTQVLLQ